MIRVSFSLSANGKAVLPSILYLIKQWSNLISYCLQIYASKLPRKSTIQYCILQSIHSNVVNNIPVVKKQMFHWNNHIEFWLLYYIFRISYFSVNLQVSILLYQISLIRCNKEYIFEAALICFADHILHNFS